MKFYESGDSSKPVIFLFPGTCCLYSSFDHILDRLHSYFYTVTVSYDGFDPNEKTEFYSMEDECEKIEQEIKKKYDGRIKAAYGCSLGGSFVSLLIQRKRIHIDHGENVLVIIEGLTMYLCEKDIRKMFFIIEKSFQEVTVMVETMSPFVVNHVKEKSIEGSNAKFTWGVKNGTELQRIVPGFSVQQEVSLVEGMKKLMPIYHVIGKIQIVRNISNKIIVLEKRGRY